MGVTFEQVSIFVLFWLLHIGWIGILIGLLALVGNRCVRGSTTSREYGWSLMCFGMLAIAIPVAAGFAAFSLPSAVQVDTRIAKADWDDDSATVSTANRSTNFNGALSGPGVSPDSSVVTNNNIKGYDFDSVEGVVFGEIPPGKYHEIAAAGFGDGDLESPDELARFSYSVPPGIAKWIALIYFTGFGVMLTRLLMAGWGCRRLLRSATRNTDPNIVQMALETSRRIGLKAMPAVSVCQRVTVPMVVGLWRPMILIPTAIASVIPAEQLRAILAHEMAHLRRFDHLVVVVQRVIESILFFHPVMWWMSLNLEQQRELCCDDLVIASGTSPLDYAQSLFYVARSNRHQHTTVAVAVDGANRSHLVTRIGRLLGEAPSNSLQTPGNLVTILAAICLSAVLLTCILFAPSGTGNGTVAESSGKNVASSSVPQVESYPAIHGFVHDENGDPMGDATIVVQEHAYKYPGTRLANGEMRKREDLTILAQTSSAMDGTFSLTDVPVPGFQSYLDSAFPITLVVMHDGHAIAWKHLEYISKRPIEFSLSRPRPVSIRFKSHQNTALEQIDVQLVGLMNSRDWQRAAEYNSEPQRNIHAGLVWSPLRGLSENLVNIQDSEAAIERLPDDSIAVVRVAAKNQPPEIIYVTNIGEVLERLSGNNNARLLSSPAEHTMQPIASIKVTVVDKATGLPVAGATIAGDLKKRHKASDENGEIQMDGLAPGKGFIVGIEPPQATSWLGHSRRIDLGVDNGTHELKVELETGIPLVGRVIDEESGDGIPDVNVMFAPTIPWKTSAVASTGKTNSQGEYRMIVPPANGSVRVASRVKGYEISARENERFRAISISVNPNDAIADTPLLKLKKLKNETVRSAEVLRIQVIDPSGKPARNAKIRLVGLNKQRSYSRPPSRKTDSAGFTEIELSGILFSYRQLVVLATDESMSLAGRANFICPKELDSREDVAAYIKQLVEATASGEDPAAEITVTLEPIATIKGTVIDSDSEEPVPYAVVRFHQQAAEELKSWDEFFPPVETDEDGNYEMKAFPGLTGFTRISHPSYVKQKMLTDFDYRTPDNAEVTNVVHRLVATTTSGDAKIQPFVAPGIGGLTGMEAYESLVNRFAADQLRFRQRLKETSDPVKQQQIMRLCPYSAYVERMLEIANSNEGRPVEAKALAWACQAPMHTGEQNLDARYRLRSEIGDRLMRDFIDSPEIESCLVSLIHSQKNPKAAAEKIIDSNANKSIQGNALLVIGNLLLNEIGKYPRAKTEAWRQGMKDEQLESEAHKVFCRIKEKFADVPYWRNENLGTVAELQLFELDHLGIGDLVEDIHGPDLDGRPMRLSDFRGKYVVLDFWGSWCGPCVGELPELIKIAEDFTEHVIVVGVMNDSPDQAKLAVEKHNVTWRNWQETGDNDPIQTRWNIDTWPTTYLIGRDGRILTKRIRAGQLHGHIEELVRADQRANASENRTVPKAAEKSQLPEMTTASDQKDRLKISVIDQEGWPMPNASVNVWSGPFNLVTRQTAAKNAWTRLQSLRANDSGEVTIDAPNFSAKLCIVARTDKDLAGVTEVTGSQVDPRQLVEVKVAPIQKLVGFVFDYDTGDPIEGCSIQVSFAGHRGSRIDPNLEFNTDAEGRFELRDLIPGMYVRMKATRKGYHFFGIRSEDVGLRQSNGVDRPYKIELLSESSYNRAIAAARLSLPDVEGMEPAQAFKLLTKHYVRAKERSKYTGSGGSNDQVHKFIRQMRTLPRGLYREAIGKLTKPTSSAAVDANTQFDAMLWLLTHNFDFANEFGVEARQIVTELSKRFAMHEKIDDALEYIRMCHPEPQEILERILREHPNRDVQGGAAITLARDLKTYSPHTIGHVDLKNLERKQAIERSYLNLIMEKYADVADPAYGKKPLGERAQEGLDWLDKYGVGGKPPQLFGQTLGGAEMSLDDYSDKYVVLHFWNSSQRTDLETYRAIDQKHSNLVQVVGVAHGDRTKAENTARDSDLDWPIFWDSYKGMQYNKGGIYEDPHLGLRWGELKLNTFKQYSTFVIDPNGKILAVGLKEAALTDFVEALVATSTHSK